MKNKYGGVPKGKKEVAQFLFALAVAAVLLFIAIAMYH